MSSSSSILASAVLCVWFLVDPGSSASISCIIDSSDPCKCSFTDTEGKDWNIDIGGYFTYPFAPVSDHADKYSYSYSCRNNACPKNVAAACQYVISQTTDYPLGKVDKDTTWEVSDPSDETFTFVITYKNGQPTKDSERQAQVTFKYGTGGMEMKVISENTKNNIINYHTAGCPSLENWGWWVKEIFDDRSTLPTHPVPQTLMHNDYTVMEASGSSVKKINPHSGGGGGKSGGKKDISGPIGIVIILLAIIGLLVYFIVGGVYLYKVKGARGKEVVIHYSFWTGLPLLIKEGFFLTISPCYKRSTYESL